MEARLAQVEALVARRCVGRRLAPQSAADVATSWARAQAKRKARAALERRRRTLADELSALVAGPRAAAEAVVSAVEAEILAQEVVKERLRQVVEEQRESVGRKRARLRTVEAQVARFRSAIEAERRKNERFFLQVAADERALEKEDEERNGREKAEMEDRRRQMADRLGALNEQVADAQSKVQDDREAVAGLERERRALERELGDAQQANVSLKQQLSKERSELRKRNEATRKRTAEVLEARANRILDELRELKQ